MKYNYFFLIIIFVIQSSIIQTNQKFFKDNITKQKIKACISLHRLKFLEEKDLIDDFFKKLTKILGRDEQRVLYLALAICVDQINNEDALKINHRTENNKIIKIYNKEIKKLYDLDQYDYSNQTNNAYLYNNFIPVFEKIYGEIEKEKENFFKEKYIYFIHTPLFKFFLIYTIINTIIIFMKRFKRKNKIDNDNNNDVNYKNCQCAYHCSRRYRKEEEEENISEQENNDEKEENNNENKKNGNKGEFRKLNKKSKIGKKKY